MARSHELAVLAEERRIVDGEEHTHRWLIHCDRREGLRVFEIRNGISDFEAVDADHGANIAALHALGLSLAKTFEDHKLLDFLLLDNVIALAQAHILSALQGSAGYLSHCDTAHIRAVFEGGNKHLRSAFHYLRCRDFLKDGVEKGGDVGGRLLPVQGHPALLCRAEDSLEIELLLACVEVEHKVEDLFLYLVRAAVRLVHLVYHHYRLLAELNSLLEYEAGLRHTPLEGIHEQEHAVRHVEHSLHFSAEVAVARGVDNVDFDILIDDGHVLGENGDSPFPLKVVVVKDKLPQIFRLTHEVGLINHPVDQGGLAVVDVRDDCYVSNICHTLLKNPANLLKISKIPR